MINLHERMLQTSAGVEPTTSWSPVRRRIQLSHQGRAVCVYWGRVYVGAKVLVYVQVCDKKLEIFTFFS